MRFTPFTRLLIIVKEKIRQNYCNLPEIHLVYVYGTFMGAMAYAIYNKIKRR